MTSNNTTMNYPYLIFCVIGQFAESIGITAFNKYVKMNYTLHILCVISKEKIIQFLPKATLKIKKIYFRTHCEKNFLWMSLLKNAVDFLVQLWKNRTSSVIRGAWVAE
jgi:hypothetical protein